MEDLVAEIPTFFRFKPMIPKVLIVIPCGAAETRQESHRII